MNGLVIALIVSLFWISYRTSQYFEDKINPSDSKVLGIIQEPRFFLPLPDKYEVISRSDEARKTDLIVNVPKPAKELRDFYKDILRSKGYQNDYEYEKDNVIEIRYLNEKEDIKITFTQNNDNTLVEFAYNY